MATTWIKLSGRIGWAMLCCVLLAPSAWAKSPNVVVFLVDDLGVMDVGPNNPQTFYETPALDALAARGARFTQGYAACPVCSPTRAALLTGKYPVRCGITDYIDPGGGNQPEQWRNVQRGWRRDTQLLPAPYRDRLALQEITLAERLKEAGYATFFAGKWHLGPEGFYPEDQGFDINQGGIERGGPYGGGKYFSPYGNPKLTDGPDGEHLPDRLARETSQFITAHRDRPFFAYFSFYSVHTPLMAPEELVEKYRAKAAKLPPADAPWGQEGKNRVRQVQDHAVYAAMVESMDRAVGQVLKTLDDLELTDNTLIIFTSDNGGLSTAEGSPTSNLPYRAGKGWIYEGGLRVPWIVALPGHKQSGQVIDAPIVSTDLVPTVLDVVGLDPPADVDGASALPALQGKSPPERAIFWHYPHYSNQGGLPAGAVREGDWKLIEWYEDGRLELYHITDDPAETNDLAEVQPERARALQEKLAAWRKATDAKMPIPR